jgi:hypothetical protein
MAPPRITLRAVALGRGKGYDATPGRRRSGARHHPARYRARDVSESTGVGFVAESGNGSGNKATFEVVRTATISAPPDAIFDQLDDFHRWTGWSPWEHVDPNMNRDYEGPDSGVGAAYAWQGTRKAGAGRMEIVASRRATSLTIHLAFLRPFSSESTVVFTLVPKGDATIVTWAMTGPKTFVTRLMGVFTSMDKMIGADFEKGLAKLKGLVEA